MRHSLFLCAGVLTLPAHLQQALCLEFAAHIALTSGRSYWRLYLMIWLFQEWNNLVLTPAQPLLLWVLLITTYNYFLSHVHTLILNG